MTMIAALACEDYAVLAVDCRVCDADGGITTDEYRKLIQVRDGFAATSGVDVGYTALAGAGFLSILRLGLRVFHAGASRRITEDDRARLGRFASPEDPRAAADPLFCVLVTVGWRGLVRALDTGGGVRSGEYTLTLPPRTPSAVRDRIEAVVARIRVDASWCDVVRILAHQVAATASQLHTVGPDVDIGVVDRRDGVLLEVHGEARQLAALNDVGLHDAFVRVGRASMWARVRARCSTWASPDGGERTA